MGILWEYNEIKIWYLSNEISKPKYLILHWDLMMIYMGIWCWFDSDFNSSLMYFMGMYLMANPKYNFLEVWTKNRSFGENDLKHPKFVKKRSAKNIQIPTHLPLQNYLHMSFTFVGPELRVATEPFSSRSGKRRNKKVMTARSEKLSWMDTWKSPTWQGVDILVWWNPDENIEHCWLDLIGGWPTPLKNDGVKVSWDDEIPNIWKK